MLYKWLSCFINSCRPLYTLSNRYYTVYEFEMFIPFSCTIWCDWLIPDICCYDSHWHISYLILTYIHPVLGMLYLTHDTLHWYLPCYIWHMIPDTGTCHAIFDTIPDTSTCHAIFVLWYLTPVLAMLYLTHDTGTWHAIFDTWYPTLVLAMLYLTYDTRHLYLPCYSWHMIYNIGTWYVILDTWYLTPVLPSIFMIIMWPDLC